MAYILFSALVAVVTTVVFLTVKPRARGLVACIGLGVFLLLTVASSLLVVSNEKIAVEKVFGRTVAGFRGPGLHLVSPLSSFQRFEALRREFPFDGIVTASDGNPLDVSVGFATKINPALASEILLHVGPEYYASLVVPIGGAATREGFSGFGWTRAIGADRASVERGIGESFRRILVQQLVSAGLDETQAAAAIEVFPVQLRKVLPDEKVRNAVAEKTAAQQDLERQQTLTEIAKEEAERRREEGTGVANLFDELPTGFTAEEISRVLSALATKTRADAMLKAVESGQVDSIIMNGDGGSTLAAPTGRPIRPVEQAAQ